MMKLSTIVILLMMTLATALSIQVRNVYKGIPINDVVSNSLITYLLSACNSSEMFQGGRGEVAGRAEDGD